jgi:serine/threonine protein kinase, bacterial
MKLMTTQLLNDRYQIIRTLGSGGFGDTFLAEDTHMPSRRLCVVKCLRPIQANPQINQLVQERFQREAAILEALGNGHSQIPMLYAYFYDQMDQQFYLVQEWVDGDTLGAVIHQQGKLNETEVRQILMALLPVFDYVHSQGMIHRDVKPENIILRQSSTQVAALSNRQPVLIDFGAVRETMGAGINSQGRPTQSIVIGTPGYMPSEQSVGRPVYSSDLYSLGMTAIYLLTGKQPQDFEINPHTSDILWQTDGNHASPQLVDILNKAISFNPRDRYQTAGEFLAALRGETQSAVTQVVLPPITMAATQVVAPAQTKMPEPLIPQAKSNLPLIGGIVAITAFISTLLVLLLRPQESKVVIVTSPSSSPLSTASFGSQQSVSPTGTGLEPVKISPSAVVQIPSPQSSPSIASGAREAIAAPTSNSTISSQPNIQSSCGYYAGEAVTGQAVNVDLCSITTNNSDKVGFVYYLGGKRMGSAANCSNGTWTTLADQQVNRPLSPATQKMLDSVCSRRQAGSSKSSFANSQVVKAIVFAPPTNIRESPDGKILCSVNKRVTINTYGVSDSWYKTDVCGSMGVIQADQLKF